MSSKDKLCTLSCLHHQHNHDQRCKRQQHAPNLQVHLQQYLNCVMKYVLLSSTMRLDRLHVSASPPYSRKRTCSTQTCSHLHALAAYADHHTCQNLHHLTTPGRHCTIKLDVFLDSETFCMLLTQWLCTGLTIVGKPGAFTAPIFGFCSCVTVYMAWAMAARFTCSGNLPAKRSPGRTSLCIQTSKHSTGHAHCFMHCASRQIPDSGGVFMSF